MNCRRLLLTVLLSACQVSSAAEDASDGTARPGPAVVAEPKTASARRVAWYAKTTTGAYEAVGSKDPKWDRNALGATNAAGIQWSGHPRANGDQRQIIFLASSAAVAAGCDDPLLLYARAHVFTEFQGQQAEVARCYLLSAENFRKSRYPAIRRLSAFLRAAEYTARTAPGDADATRKARALVDEAMALLPEALADREMPVRALSQLLGVAGDASAAVEGDRKPVSARVIEAMEKEKLPRAAVLAARGAANIKYAWDARGTGFADTVTPEGRQKLKGRLALARQQLEEAYKLDPSDPSAATSMLDVELGDSRGRAEMEKWFGRAVKADPDNRVAYGAKLNWLEPKWHGSVEEMLAFGRECHKQGRWEALIPLVLVDAHWSAARYTPAGYKPAAGPDYFQANPAAWDEVKAVYGPYLKEPDASNYHRTRYAVIAAYCGQWVEADATFKALGRMYTPDVLYDPQRHEALVREAAEKAAGAPAPAPEDGAPLPF